MRVADDRELRKLRSEGLSASWLATRLGTQPAHVDALRREGALFGVRPPGAHEHLYPAWQFARGGTEASPDVKRVLRAARDAGLGELELLRLLQRREGLGQQRLVDALRAGRVDYVLAQVRAGASG
jgi:hypothetical protein